jgi:hypothetical protein
MNQHTHDTKQGGEEVITDGGRSSGKIYIIESGGYYKIGVSINVENRLSQIQTSTPHDVTLVAKVSVKNNSAGRVETALHQYYSPVHKNGEWFNLSPREAAGFKLIDEINADKLDSIVKDLPANGRFEERGSLVGRLQDNASISSTSNSGVETL